MSDMNNMMRMPGQPPNGMPMQPMNMNPPPMMPGQMVPPPFMGHGGQPMRQMNMPNMQPPPHMFPPNQMPGMPPMPHHMGPPPGMMNQFQQYPMQQLPNFAPPYQPPNFSVPPIINQQPPQMGAPPGHLIPPQLNNAPQNPNIHREPIVGQPTIVGSSTAPPTNAQQAASQAIAAAAAQNPSTQQSAQADWLKLFVNNIHPDLPDEFVKNLLEECGEVEKWKRQSDEKGNLNKFGIVQYKLFESVLKCIRILDGFEIIDEKLIVKSSATTQAFIEKWKKLRDKQWEEEQKQKGETEFMSFDQFLEKDDYAIKEKIQFLMKSIDEKVEKVREKKREEEEKKLHPRERERENKKRHQQREIEKKGKDKLKEWMQIEDDMAREKRKEREREKERERNRQRALDRELAYTDDVDRHKQRGRMMERKRQRHRELEEDENDRRRELELLNPPEPEFNIPMPEEPMEDFEVITINKINGHDNVEKDKGMISLNFEEIELNQNKKIVEEVVEYSIENPRNNIVNQAINKLNIQFKQDFDDKIKKGIYVMPAMEIEYEEPVANINEIHSSRAKQMDQTPTGNSTNQEGSNIKQVFGGLEEEEEEERQKNLRKIDLPKIGNARFIEQREIIRKQQIETTDQKPPVARQLTEEEMKKELKEILSLIPPAGSNNSVLFAFNFNWELFDNSGLLDKKIKPFLYKKSQELFGHEEQSFVDMIVKKIQSKPMPEKLIKQLTKILDEDDSEKFIAALWRIMIFETMKYERFLHIV